MSQRASYYESLVNRLAAAALGALPGLLLGLGAAVVAFVVGWFPNVSFATWIFGSAAVSAVVGFVWPAAAHGVTLSVLHAAVGVVNGLDEELAPQRDAMPWDRVGWIRGFAWFGLMMGWLAWVACRHG